MGERLDLLYAGIHSAYAAAAGQGLKCALAVKWGQAGNKGKENLAGSGPGEPKATQHTKDLGLGLCWERDQQHPGCECTP